MVTMDVHNVQQYKVFREKGCL